MEPSGQDGGGAATTVGLAVVLHAFGEPPIFGEAFGAERPRVVALHGWGRTSADFREVLEGLDAIALDLPGFGATPPPPQAWGSREYAEAVSAILDACNTPVVVVGHSFGGRVAVHLGATHPELVNGLVLTGVPLIRQRPSSAKSSWRFRMAKRLHALGLITDERMESRRQRSGSADYRAAQGVMRNVLVRAIAEDYRAQLQAINCPVELVWGENDTAAPPHVAQEAAVILGPTARLNVLPGIGHDTLAHAPHSVRSSIDALLNRQ